MGTKDGLAAGLACLRQGVAPDEHILEGVSEEALRIMTGLFWDLGEPVTPS